MEFRMFHEFPSLDGRSQTAAFDEAFAQVPHAQVVEALRLLCREVKPRLR